MPDSAIRAALDRSAEDAAAPLTAGSPVAAGCPPARRLAIGDPQAPLETFFSLLDRRGLLDDAGRLIPEVLLVSMGDHFDWGGREDRAHAARGGAQILAWLAAHPPDRAVIIAGNHDLARVGELARFDDTSFAHAQAEADLGYHEGRALSEENFRARWNLPSWEVTARDFSSFRASQRALVEALLRSGRLLAAYASGSVLLSHAGITRDDLNAAALPAHLHGSPVDAARAIDGALRAAVEKYDGGPLRIPGLHTPGDASGEGDGMFYHRASPTPGPRRFLPSRLPVGLTQGIGHIGDKKSRTLLELPTETATVGPLRHMRIREGGEITYAAGVPAETDPSAATLLLLDGGMAGAPLDRYELLDLDTLRPA